MEELKELGWIGIPLLLKSMPRNTISDFPDQPFSSYFSLDSGRAGRLWGKSINDRRFAAGGFSGYDWIAESEPGMWTSILLSNPQAILERIADFKDRLDRWLRPFKPITKSHLVLFLKGRKHRKKKCRSISVLDVIGAY